MGVRKSLVELGAGLAAMPAATRVMVRRWDEGLAEMAAVLQLTKAAGWYFPSTGRKLAEILARRTGLSVAAAADEMREAITLGADGATALVEVAMRHGMTLPEATAWAQDAETWR